MARVIISSGHTSASPGVVSFGLREYDLARKIAKYSLKYIRQAGIISLSTPPNLDLAQRIDWINKTGYNAGSNDITIEIHINDGGKRGIEGWFAQDGNNPSQKLTDLVVNSICQDLQLPNQGVHSEFQHELGSISFIHEVEPIASIVECCYIDNPDDSAILGNDFELEKIGRSIARGVISYFGLNIALPEVVPTQENAGRSGQQVITPNQNAFVQQATYNQPVAYQQPQTSYQPTTYSQDSVSPQQYQYPNQNQQIQSQQQQSIQPIQQIQTQPAQMPQQQQVQNYQRPVTPDQQLQQFQNYQRYQAPTQPIQTQSVQAQTQPVQSQSPSYNRPGTAASGATSSSTNPGFLPREERKEMIIKNYAKILGRDPNENDLNYFLNTGIKEDDLIKKMVDSQEHVDLVKSRQEIINARIKSAEEQDELMTLRSKVKESDTIIQSLNGSIAQKNEAIANLNKQIKELEQRTTNAQTPVAESKSTSTTKKKKYKGNLSDRVFKAFSDILE